MFFAGPKATKRVKNLLDDEELLSGVSKHQHI